MKFMHLSDLHLGKQMGAYPLFEDQEYIMSQIVMHIDREKPDAILIAGDIFDRAVPPVQALKTYEDFIMEINQRGIPLLAISGNHDSADRNAFGAQLMAKEGIHMAPAYRGDTTKISLEDEFGVVDFYLLPFIKPTHVRLAWPEEADGIENYRDAMEVAIRHMFVGEDAFESDVPMQMELDMLGQPAPASGATPDVSAPTEASAVQGEQPHRKVLIAHQFVAGALRSESDTVQVGGTDNIDATVFKDFDYVALGHLHRPQWIGDEQRIRYCGTPLKYSLSEENNEKSITMIELREPGAPPIATLIPLQPKHDVRTIRGKYADLVSREFYEDTETDDYIHAVLTDEEDVINGFQLLQTVYPNLLGMEYDNARTRTTYNPMDIQVTENKAPKDLFQELYETMNGTTMTPEQEACVDALIEEIWGGEQ